MGRALSGDRARAARIAAANVDPESFPG